MKQRMDNAINETGVVFWGKMLILPQKITFPIFPPKRNADHLSAEDLENTEEFRIATQGGDYGLQQYRRVFQRNH